MLHPHTVVWIDQHEAKLFHFDKDNFEAVKVENAHHHVRKHPSETAERNHPADAQHYFHEVAVALGDDEAILVVGPSTAKLHFIKHVHTHEQALEARIVGVETVDHPTDRQLVAYARQYFYK